MTIARLEKLEITLVVAVETVVVSLMTPVPYHEATMLLRKNYMALGVELQLQRVALFMACVTIQARGVPARGDQFARGKPHGSGIRDGGLHQRNIRQSR